MPKILPLHPSGNKYRSDKPVVDIACKNYLIKIRYIFPGFTISDAKPNPNWRWKSFKEVEMSGTGFLSINHEPLLPCMRTFVQIPPGYDVDAKKLKKPHRYLRRYNKKCFKNKLIRWAEESLTYHDEVELDDEKYDVDGFNPDHDDMVEVDGPFYMNGYKTILVEVKPMQYNPKRRLLRGYGKIVVTVPLKSKRMRKKRKIVEVALTDAAHNLEGFGNLLLNPDRKFFTPAGITPSLRKDVRTCRYGPEFLIIYDDKLKVPAQMLKKWKQKCGLLTKTVSIKTVGNRASQIKDYIRSERKKCASRLRYVLLLGDVSKIPLSQQGEGKNTDHYFYTHKDPGKSECILPWVSGGRIPVENLEDAISVVNKIIRYEQEPPLDPEYYKRMTFAAYFQDNQGAKSDDPDGRADRNYIKTMEAIANHLNGQGFKINRVYVSQCANPAKYRDGSKVPKEVKKNCIIKENAAVATKLLVRYINEGQLIVGYRGHGEADGWQNPPLKNDDLLSITSDCPSIFFSINCDTGCFQERNTEVFAQNLLKLNGGAPALIAATEFSWVWRDDSLIKALFDAIWPGLVPAFPKTNANYPIKYQRVGDILDYAKTYLLIKHGQNNRTKEQFELFHVIGDPTMEIWSHQPYTPKLYAGKVGDMLHIKMSPCPSDAVLTIWHRDDLLKRIKPSGARLAIPLEILVKGINQGEAQQSNRICLSICLAAPGCRYAEEQVWLSKTAGIALIESNGFNSPYHGH